MINLHGKTLAGLIGKAFVVWLLISLSGFFWGERLITTLFPFYEQVIEAASEDYQADLSLRSGVESRIVLAATPLKAKVITAGRSLPAGHTIESKVTALHALETLVILLTIIFSWPLENTRQLAYLCLLAIPSVLAVSALTVPLQLLGTLEMGFQNAAHAAGYARAEPWVLQWMLLTEGGGRWLIGALVGISCGTLATRLSQR